MLELRQIREAADRLGGRFRRTELIHSHYYSQQVGTPIHFKCENLQRTGSFKIRGAFNFLSSQSKNDLARGVITASAGNHAQGVACAARMLGVRATVVMPETTPLAKVLATRDYEAEVILHGDTYDDAAERARQIEKQSGALAVPAFDHPLIMAGQGTVGLEIVEDLPDFDTVLVPVGGGGLISGIATAVKAQCPRARIIGVEAAGAPSALLSRRKGKAITLSTAASLADGIVIKHLGEQTYPVIEALVDDIVTVEEEEIAQSIVSLMEKGKLVVEGAGAVSLAAVLYGDRRLHRGRTVCVLSGGNIDVQTIARVVERGMMSEGRYLKVAVELTDRPGALARLAALLGESGANIFHVSHDRRRFGVPLGRAEVDLELETRGPEHIAEILEMLHREGYGAKVVR
ncbi:MAG: threonine ammonia-lyase [Desulfuromonadales bacterium]|nr:threonine ammonia-lyase [Desulfuromonadales bacterium]NIR32926.1 threonine ammonia-lyase [Desulfuromonadales bacterium]NIS39173.1 threonine ammonia-lyase [Desulfuromonadales bacterium]